MLLYQHRTLSWAMKYSLGLGHTIVWALVGYGSPLMIDNNSKKTDSKEPEEVSQNAISKSSPIQMMTLSSIILSFTGVSFLAFTYFRAGHQVKELIYKNGVFTLKNFRPFGSTTATFNASALKLKGRLTGLENVKLETNGSGSRSYNLSKDGDFINSLYLQTLLSLSPKK